MLVCAPVASFPRLKQWLRHHVISVVGTGADFGTMVLLVELFGLSPVPSTGLGAAVGGITNFVMARGWVYRPEPLTVTVAGAPLSLPLPVRGQMVRYLLVSLASLGLNTAGEHLFAEVLHVQYVVGRVITAVIVSNVWNYPMQRFYVFGGRKVRT